MIHPITFSTNDDMLLINGEHANKLKAKPQAILWCKAEIIHSQLKDLFAIIPVELVKKEVQRATRVDVLQASRLSSLSFRWADAIEIPWSTGMAIKGETDEKPNIFSDVLSVDLAKALADKLRLGSYPHDRDYAYNMPSHLRSDSQNEESARSNTEIKPKLYATYIPAKVFTMCKSGAYLVGGYARYVLRKSKTFGDYDLIVAPSKWHTISVMIPPNAKLNRHGGLKFTIENGKTIDVWPCSIEQHLRQCKPGIYGQEFVVDYVNNKVFTSYSVGTKMLDEKQSGEYKAADMQDINGPW